MESIIRDKVMEHFLDTGYFSDKQYVFIKGRSTVLQLLKILNDWTYNYDLGLYQMSPPLIGHRPFVG